MDVTVTNEFIHATTIIGIVDISRFNFFVCVGIISPPIWPYNKLKSDKVKKQERLPFFPQNMQNHIFSLTKAKEKHRNS